ncbi:MBL fold metallo-hydrolase [Lipingzhangella sp. LS1_29]|uniref:MBL fold metallo-hydrolase n=1 Tax=Lipingzhangella rawalii TaxID=2055835 RepID=A0ABU2H384_9ACTN|nr:MBL fold metallo-hydrolase [Lipingzhangella rawalii]MDS1269756.1 MBL fold metallo-hydrolase [Lipingzhangella rawalii]
MSDDVEGAQAVFWKRKRNKGGSADTDPAEAAGSGNSGGDTEATAVRADAVECVVTSGTLTVDGEEFSVTNNTWIVPADEEGVIVVDPAHDAEAILKAVGEREVYLVACTNGYNTHIGAAIEVAERDDADIALHRREVRAWRKLHGIERTPDIEIEGGGQLAVGDLTINILGIPGTSAGSLAFYLPDLGIVFSGDTLLAGQMGTVGDGFVDYTRQLSSIGEVLLTLPNETRVLPDRDEETTVGDEQDNFDRWVAGG